MANEISQQLANIVQSLRDVEINPEQVRKDLHTYGEMLQHPFTTMEQKIDYTENLIELALLSLINLYETKKQFEGAEEVELYKASMIHQPSPVAALKINGEYFLKGSYSPITIKGKHSALGKWPQAQQVYFLTAESAKEWKIKSLEKAIEANPTSRDLKTHLKRTKEAVIKEPVLVVGNANSSFATLYGSSVSATSVPSYYNMKDLDSSFYISSEPMITEYADKIEF